MGRYDSDRIAARERASWEQGLTRRGLLAVAGATAALGALGPLARPLSAAAAGSGWPRRTLTDADALSVDASQFIGEGQFESWLVELESIGPRGQKGLRATGSPEHEQYIAALAASLQRAGVTNVELQRVPMTRWTVSEWSLAVFDGPNPAPVTTASYVPYSGQTSAAGITAPLALLPAGTAPAPGSLTGKIAVFDVPIASVPLGLFEGLAYPDAIFNAPASRYPKTMPYQRPFLAQAGAAAAAMKAAGAVGMVGVIDYPPDGAYGSYFPYDGTIKGVPGVYVDRVAGASLKQQASAGATARLVLPAEVAPVTTHNIVGFIPGRSSELVTLHSHSDGTNALEENGAAAIVAMSQYLSRLPRAALPRTVMILITSGHFAGGVGARTFRADHADLVERTNGAVTIEHLGALEWEELPSGAAMAPTGSREFGAIFAPRSKGLVQAAAGAASAGRTPCGVLHPTNENASGSADDPAWPGEGQYLFADRGMPDANYIAGPTYLLNWGISIRDRIDASQMRYQAVVFTEMVLTMTRMSRPALRTYDLPELPSVSV